MDAIVRHVVKETGIVNGDIVEVAIGVTGEEVYPYEMNDLEKTNEVVYHQQRTNHPKQKARIFRP